jgi:alanyl-tRNA synthetase
MRVRSDARHESKGNILSDHPSPHPGPDGFDQRDQIESRARFLVGEPFGAPMTRLLYETDPYLSKFDATVEAVNGEWVVLDRTAFFPGGGGQDADTGWIEDLEVVEMRSNGALMHRVPDNHFVVGDRVECEIDWERRHDLMRGHTGEHLLFSTLSKINPEIELVKIAITPKKKSFMVRGMVNWALITIAQQEANHAIMAQLPVTENWVSKDSDIIKDIRIKVERIHGEKVRIINIGEIDKAACAGVHIQNTRELRMLLVTKLTSARPAGDFEIEFETGRTAMESALRLSVMGLQAADVFGARPEDLVSAVENLKEEMRGLRTALRRYSQESLANIRPEKFEGVRIYSGAFEGIDKKALIDAANDFVKGERTVVVLASADDRLLLVVASSKDLDMDSREVLLDALKPVEGKGGGGRNFASGGAAMPQTAGDVVARGVQLVKAKFAR